MRGGAQRAGDFPVVKPGGLALHRAIKTKEEHL
jgi:hypothetical protein